MTDEQFKELMKEVRALRTNVYELRQELSALQSSMKQNEKLATERHSIIAQWVMPDHIRVGLSYLEAERADMPEDLKHLFKT